MQWKQKQQQQQKQQRQQQQQRQWQQHSIVNLFYFLVSLIRYDLKQIRIKVHSFPSNKTKTKQNEMKEEKKKFK